ncbi:UDP-sugar-dependent glycosyltransferase 52 [Hordeum vulgare]|nr:UDP-sugar-dependent glycosyltransferase 52 [Hordeum vulgare]
MGNVQALADAVRWDPKQVYGGEAAGAGGGEKFLNLNNLVSIGRMASRPLIGCTHRVNIGKERMWLKLPVDCSKFVPVALVVLVVQEKYRDWVLDGVWKLPTGFIQEVRTHRSQKKYAREPSERSRKKQGLTQVLRAASSKPEDNGNLHRSSTMPGVIKDSEITTETPGPSNLESSKTERRKQSNPTDDPAKQLLDDKISIGKKVCIPGPLILLATVKDDGTVVVNVPGTLEATPIDVGAVDGYEDVVVEESFCSQPLIS